MLLIYGDLTRSTWLFLFAVISIARGRVYTHSAFCQASGFLVQYGTETSGEHHESSLRKRHVD
jgi:G protein-coupled receptor GPR1